MNSNASLSLADLSLPRRISTLIALAKRFGPVLPIYGVVAVDGNWMCECGELSCKAGKHPRIKSWVTRATKDTRQIADWAMRWPLANWAIHCTEINVVDLDRKPGKPDGVITLACWEDALGVTTPDSVRVTTGTGIQIYFQPGGLKTTANPDGTGIDVRAAGGYVLAPGSRHPNGRIYQIDLEEELAPCPEWLIESLTVPAPQEGGRERSSAHFPKHNTVPYAPSGEGGGFWLDPAAKLNAWEVLRIEQLCQRKPRFAATWAMDRRNRFQFQAGRNSPSEYEGALSFYLRQDGWNPQQIMDAITVWRRQHDLPAPRYHSRYRTTIGKAMSLVTVNPMEVKEPKGAWKHGETEAGLLDATPGAPKRLRAVVEEVGLDAAAVRMALTRRVRAGQALHVGREYLAVLAAEETPAPAAVPAYDPSVPAAPKVTAYDPYDDPFAVPDGRTWQPDKLDDFAEEEAAEPVLIRVGGMHGADDCGGGSIPTPCRPSITDAWA